MTNLNYNIIVARSKNNIIGNQRKIPWHIKEDLQHFKKTTIDCPVIMGRKTWDSLCKKPLPNRLNIVLSKSYTNNGIMLDNKTFGFNDYLKANLFIKDLYEFFIYNLPIYVIGGEQIYNLYLPIVDNIILSAIPEDFEGDSYFKFDKDKFDLYSNVKKEGYNIEYWSRKILEK